MDSIYEAVNHLENDDIIPFSKEVVNQVEKYRFGEITLEEIDKCDGIYTFCECLNYLGLESELNIVCKFIHNKMRSYNFEVFKNLIDKYPKNVIDLGSISQSNNLTLDIIEKYMYEYENIRIILYNTCLVPEFVEKYIFEKPDMKNISRRMSQSFIEKHIDKSWDWKEVSRNNNITLDFIEKYIDKPWDWEYISRIKSIPVVFIEKYIDKPWDWEYISKNNENIEDIVERFPLIEWNWNIISHNKYITPEFIEKYSDKDFIWNEIFIHRDIDFIEKYIDKEVNWGLLSCNQNLPLDFIEKYIDKSWNWYKLSFNKNLTTEFIEKYIDKRWEWSIISMCKSLNVSFIEKYMHKFRFSLDHIVKHKCIEPDFIIKHFDTLGENASEHSQYIMDMVEKWPDKQWDYRKISYNHSIDITFIKKNIDKMMVTKNVYHKFLEDKYIEVLKTTTLSMDTINLIVRITE